MARVANHTKNFQYHKPILVTRILSFVNDHVPLPQEPFWIMDGTLGDAGHTLVFLDMYPQCRVIAFDRDEEMLARAHSRLSEEGFTCSRDPMDFQNPQNQARVLLCHENYENAAKTLDTLNIQPHVILIDAGVSMYHFRMANRGFSYNDESLDMRLDFHVDGGSHSKTKTAQEVVNKYSYDQLLLILQKYGEQKFAKRIVNAIIASRPIVDARRLALIVRNAVPFPKSNVHPATTVFQALRIYVNHELESLESAVAKLPMQLAQHGIFCVISFHSLEDRIVKQEFKKTGQKKKEKIVAERKKKYKKNNTMLKDFWILTPTPQQVSQMEEELNPASRSAKLRVLQRCSLGEEFPQKENL